MAIDAATTAVTGPDADEVAGPEHPSAQPSRPDSGYATKAPVDGGLSPRSGIRAALLFGLISVGVLAGLDGWLGDRAYRSHQDEQQRALFVQVARQGALNLTTIDYTHADADVERVLDSATGTFHDEFQSRSKPFIDVVKQAQSRSEGTVTEAGLESQHGHQAQVLVAVSVKTSAAGTTDPQPRAWRMRISVPKLDAGVKVSNVEFVP